MNFFKILFLCVIAYLVGSIPWGLLIGKVFFKKDIRKYGSGNIGGTNAGRVLGRPIGLLVIFLDAMKAFLFMALCNVLCKDAVPFAGLCCVVGHCFSIITDFNGGKGVATGFGYLLGLAVFGFEDAVFCFIYPLLIFLLTLGLSRMVSLSSMVSLLSAAIIGFIFFNHKYIAFLTLILAILVIVRHIPNIIRIYNKSESKVSFLR